MVNGNILLLQIAGVVITLAGIVIGTRYLLSKYGHLLGSWPRFSLGGGWWRSVEFALAALVGGLGLLGGYMGLYHPDYVTFTAWQAWMGLFHVKALLIILFCFLFVVFAMSKKYKKDWRAALWMVPIMAGALFIAGLVDLGTEYFLAPSETAQTMKISACDRFSPDATHSCLATEEWSRDLPADRPLTKGAYQFCFAVDDADVPYFETKRTGVNTYQMRSHKGSFKVKYRLVPSVPCPNDL